MPLDSGKASEGGQAGEEVNEKVEEVVLNMEGKRGVSESGLWEDSYLIWGHEKSPGLLLPGYSLLTRLEVGVQPLQLLLLSHFSKS